MRLPPDDVHAPRSSPRRRLRRLPALVARYRHSLFWKMAPAMFLVSCVGAGLLMTGATILEDVRLRQALAPTELQTVLAAAVARATPLATQSGAPAPGCADTLQILADRVLSAAVGDRTGDANANGFYRASQSGRLVALAVMADGSMCRFPGAGSTLTPALQKQLDNALLRRYAGTALVEHDGGWTSVAALPPTAGTPAIVVGMHVLSPLTKLIQPRSVYGPLAIFILSINTLAALALVLLLIRRIRRADQAASAWTLGALTARIDDRGRDEFSRLARKFDRMADAMSNMIAVRQALAAAEERNRLARDLHDSVKQRAFALNLQLSTACETMPADSPGLRQVEAALALTNQLQRDLSSVIRRLEAPTIAETGFREVIADSVRTMLAGAGIDWSIHLDERDERLISARPDIAHQLALITVEAVANAMKHARCTRCTIVCHVEHGACSWRIGDNGVGMPPGVRRVDGMGLGNMRLRAENLPCGSFALDANAGGGSVITVRFLLQPT